MNLRLLGFCALVGAPFLLITYLTFGAGIASQKTSLDGFYSVLYITGWMCSILGLWHGQVTGTSRWGRIVLVIQLLFLMLANISNVMLLLQMGLHTKLYFILDLFWPVSNIWMLVTGLTVVAAKQLKGWMRFVPLVVGLWLPITLVGMGLTFGFTEQIMFVGGVYSAFAWTLLGIVVYQLDARPVVVKPQIA